MITGHFALDWALISVSLFNAILLLWLGLIIMLNAEHRTLGLWLLAGGLLLGALFFISHTAMLGHDMTTTVSRGLDFWWQVGWIPVVLAPLVWHFTALWYAGFWDHPNGSLRRRHVPGLLITGGLAAALLALMILARALPTYTQIAYRDVAHVPTLGGFPVLFLLYPPFVFLSIILPLDALYRPGPTKRMMGDLARQRARPWLLGASLALLLVGLSITAFFAWALNGYRVFGGIYVGMENEIAVFDLVLSGLIAAAIILLGQAIVSYEIFTGKTLPRRGFFRHWRSVILLGAGYAGLAAWTVVIHLRPIYSMLLATALVMVFFALFSWRSFVEREQLMIRLRPFVSSQRLVHGFLDVEDDAASRAQTLFRAVCEDVLGAAQARLIPLGVLAPLVTTPLDYPPSADRRALNFSPALLGDDPGAGLFPLDPAQYDGLRWAIPLWAERGLIGALLLGPKQDGGLYTQEEIEIARASAERVVDMLAGEQIARRLIEIQRRRLAETKVLDLRTRRLLHDEILPELHLIALRLSASQHDPAVHAAIQALVQLHHQMADLIHTSNGALTAGPGGDLVVALRRLVDEEFAGAFDSVAWISPETLPELEALIQDVVFNAVREAIRNAALHGRGSQPDRVLNLTVEIRHGPGLAVMVSDDGVGVAYRLAEHHGEALAGSGGGLTLHSTLLAVVGGELSIDSQPEGGTHVKVSIPV